MRADMAKVLVERPRLGGGFRGPDKGYRQKVREAIAAGDGGPVREGIKAPHRLYRKTFNEHLGPLRRYINSQVGRPWNKVYSEICAHIDRGNVVQKHILTHLFDYVVTNAILIDGEPCYGEGPGTLYGQPLRESYSYNRWYVCPKSGVLKRAQTRPKRDRRRKRSSAAPEPTFVRVNNRVQCRLIGGVWELVDLAPLPPPGWRQSSTAVDVVLSRPVRDLTDSTAKRTYGDAVYAVARRRLRKKELLQYPIPIDLIR
jgi:hypothetical protein